jgi:hypothetical protein
MEVSEIILDKEEENVHKCLFYKPNFEYFLNPLVLQLTRYNN